MEYSYYELAHGIKGGDNDALELLVRRWYPRVYGYVFKLTMHEQDAYDLTQDVFIAMMQNIGGYTPWKKFDGWLFTIEHNKNSYPARCSGELISTAQVSNPHLHLIINYLWSSRGSVAKEHIYCATSCKQNLAKKEWTNQSFAEGKRTPG